MKQRASTRTLVTLMYDAAVSCADASEAAYLCGFDSAEKWSSRYTRLRSALRNELLLRGVPRAVAVKQVDARLPLPRWAKSTGPAPVDILEIFDISEEQLAKMLDKNS